MVKMLTNIGKRWMRACTDLGIPIVAPFSVTFADGQTVEFDALVKNFGAKYGMLLAADFRRFEMYTSELAEKKFGYSVMADTIDRNYDPENYKEVLCDWGWSGDPALKPTWVTDPVDEDEIHEK